MNVEAQLDSWRARVDERLSELLPPADEPPASLHEAMRYACLAPGKRLRPLLCLASAHAVGADAVQAIDGGCAVEMVHAFSLVHDDLPSIDDDALRRGQPTCHVKFGEAIAILAGDALFALAFDTLAHATPSAESRAAALQALSRASGSSGLVGGEVLDVLSEGAPPEAGLVETIHRKKTAALIAAACRIGGLFGGADLGACVALEGFGMEVGLAFQITDDLLNETADTAVLGKAAGSDRNKQKATFPAVYGMERSRSVAMECVERGMARLSEAGLKTELLEALARGSVDRVR